MIRGKLGTVGQITVCRCYEETEEGSLASRILLLANTHLFYHPSAAFVRLLQTDAIVRTILHVRDKINSDGLQCLQNIVIDGEEFISIPADTDNDVDYDMIRFGHDVTEEVIRDSNLPMGCPIDEMSPSTSSLSPSPPPSAVSVIIMGDFNSTPETAVIEYFHE